MEICNLRHDDETVTATAEALYADLSAAGVEVLYDDRDVRPGVMFADADLYGVPIRAVVSPKTCERGVVEVSFRDKSAKFDVEIKDASQKLSALVREKLAEYR